MIAYKTCSRVKEIDVEFADKMDTLHNAERYKLIGNDNVRRHLQINYLYMSVVSVIQLG